jgi:hypothetical protein
VVDLIGENGAEEFFELYRENYVQEKDIQAIAEWGYDHVRLPFHYDVLYDLKSGAFREDGFELIDRFLGWCRQCGLYVILDMHAAPGAQSHANIADSDGEARLWTEPKRYQPVTIQIWEEIARRYKDEKLIIGYDIVNEPVLPDGSDIAVLRDFYVEITAAIRKIDPHHIIFIEGDGYATRFQGMAPAFDDNMVWAFHKYWNRTDPDTFNRMLAFRENTNRPVWLGESGENSNQWFFEVTRFCEENKIGWNWWTHKKVNTITAPLSARMNEDHEKVVAFLQGRGPRPDEATARAGWMGLAAGLDIDACDFHPDVLDALFREDHGTRGIPYAELTVPGTIDAVLYDMGANSVAYFDTEVMQTKGYPGSGNNGQRFRNDGVDIQENTDPEGPAFNVGWIEDGEWMKYTVSSNGGSYAVTARVSAEHAGGRLRLLVNGKDLAAAEVPSTGGLERWQDVSLGRAEFPEGTLEITLEAEKGGFNLSRISID